MTPVELLKRYNENGATVWKSNSGSRAWLPFGLAEQIRILREGKGQEFWLVWWPPNPSDAGGFGSHVIHVAKWEFGSGDTLVLFDADDVGAAWLLDEPRSSDRIQWERARDAREKAPDAAAEAEKLIIEAARDLVNVQ